MPGLKPLSLLGLGRAPHLPPRRRRISAQATENLRAWVTSALELAPSEQLETSEWVSLDPRCQPHTTLLVVGAGPSRALYRIDKASERIQASDVLALARRPETAA